MAEIFYTVSSNLHRMARLEEGRVVELDFEIQSQTFADFLKIIFEIATVTKTKLKLDVCVDEKDNMLLECAVEGKADYLISGDDHLLRLKNFRNVKIVSVKEFLER